MKGSMSHFLQAILNDILKIKKKSFKQQKKNFKTLLFH